MTTSNNTRVGSAVRQKLTAAAFVLAAAAGPAASFSQPVSVSDEDVQAQIAEAIETERSLNGPQSEALIGPLSALALYYQERGDHGLAAAVVQQVLQVVRANFGLHSLEQAPLISQLIANEEAAGNDEAAWDLERELLALVERHPEDLRTVSILRAIGDKRLRLHERYVAGEFPAQLVLGCYYGRPNADSSGGEGCTSGSRGGVIRKMILDAQRNYALAIAVILRNELYSSSELEALEMALVRSSDLIRAYNEDRLRDLYVMLDGFEHPPWDRWMEPLIELANWDLPDAADGSLLEPVAAREQADLFEFEDYYRLGRASLERLLAYELADPAPSRAQVDALLQMADWDLLYSHNGLALDRYEAAYRMLAAMGAPPQSIDEVFSPKTPVVLPTFLPNPLAARVVDETAGYIDAAFEITRFGRGRRFEIRDATANATEADEDELRHLVETSRFRPRATAGRFDRSSAIVVRYYLRDGGLQ